MACGGQGGHGWDSLEQQMLRQIVGYKVFMRVTINMYQRNGEQQDWAERWQTWKAGAVLYCPGLGGMLDPYSLAWLNLGRHRIEELRTGSLQGVSGRRG